MGGTLILDSDEGISDENGRFTIKSTINEDTLAQMLEEYMLTPDVVFQQVFVDSRFYLKKELIQFDEVLHLFRPKIAEDELLAVSVWESGILNLTFRDIFNPELYGSTSVEFRSIDEEIGFRYGIGNTDNQSEE